MKETLSSKVNGLNLLQVYKIINQFLSITCWPQMLPVKRVVAIHLLWLEPPMTNIHSSIASTLL